MIPETDQYAWLNREGAPKMIVEAIRHYGVLETPGPGNTVSILAWARELGLGAVYTKDSIAWCGLFMALVAKRSGKKYPEAPLWALNWATFGHGTPTPMLGDVLVFKRDGGGHVGLYVGEDKTCWHVLAGNQGDKVSIVRILKNRLYACRRPEYSIGVPDNVRQIFLSDKGGISENEA